MKTNRCTLHFVWMAQASNSVLTLHSGGSLAVLESPLASLGRGSLVLTRHLGWEADWGGGGASGWGAAGRRLRFFVFGAVLALLLDDDDREAAMPPPSDPYPSQSGMEIHPSSRYTWDGSDGMLEGRCPDLLHAFHSSCPFSLIFRTIALATMKESMAPRPPSLPSQSGQEIHPSSR